MQITLLMALLVALAAACGPTPAPQVVKETVVVKETAVVKETVVITETQVVEKEVLATATAVPEPAKPAMKTDPNILFIPSLIEPNQLDPDVWYDVGGWEPQRFVYETLLTYKGNSTTEFEPRLAESWEVSDDRLVYTFHLRQGVKFHDGTPFNAEAVKFNFERRLAVDRGPAYMLYNVAETEVVDEYTLRVTLDKPIYNFLHFLASLWGPKMMSPTAVQENATASDPWALDWAIDHAVSTGPFTLERWTPGQELVLTKFDDYWGGWDHPHVEQVVVRFVPEMATQQLLLENGDLDIVTGRLPFAQLDSLKEMPGMVLEESPSNFMGIMTINVQNGPLKDPKVREALAWAFDYEAALEQIGRGYRLPAKSLFPIGFEGYDQGLLPYKKDLEKARQLLEEAGYGDGLTLELIHTDGDADMLRPVAQMYQADLAEIGVNLEIKEVPMAIIWDYYAPDAGIQLFVDHVTPDASDPFSWLYIAFHSEGGINFSFYSNPDFDSIVEQAWATPKLEDRLPLWQQAADILIKDNPAIFPWQEMDEIAHWDYVKGIVRNQGYPRSIDLYRVYKEQ